MSVKTMPPYLGAAAALAQSRSLIEQQRFAEAEDLLRGLINADARNHAALHLLALLACQFKRFDVAEPLAREAGRLAPSVAAYRMTSGRALKGLGRWAEAEAVLRRALRLDPTLADAQVLLGLVLKNQQRHDEAIAAYQAALKLRPECAEAQVNLANILRERGDVNAAAAFYRSAAAAAPELAAAQSALAASLLTEGREKEALEQYLRALALKPDQPEQQFLRGWLTQRQGGGSAEAIEAYGRVVEQQPDHADAWVNLGLALVDSGRAMEALECYRRAIEIDGDHFEAHLDFGVGLSGFGAQAEAITMLRRAVELQPDNTQALNSLGAVLVLDSRLVEAEALLRRALTLEPNSPQISSNLGAALRGPGRQRESVAVLRSVLAADPDYRSAHDNLLLSLLYADGVGAEEVVAAARAYGSSTSADSSTTRPPPRSDAGRRLRIGYVSPDLRAHSVAHFVEPLLVHHDRSRFDVYCYHVLAQEDVVSQRLRGACDHWFNAYGLSDGLLAERIREDEIDILIDLAGHTGHNSLPAFAAQPAPVQLTWLGFPSTVGLPAIDYRVTDWQVDPQGYERFNTETPLRLPHSYFCYRPGEAPDIGACPADGSGAITFGSFNGLAKLSDANVLLWARVLHAVPGSRLLLKNRMFAEALTRERVSAAFAAAGVDGERLELLTWTPESATHLELYNRIDIALDTFPYNGATTSCEALWMGVPVVSRCGETHAARMGRSILTAAGLAELVADSDEAFIHVASTLAANNARRAALRSDLRKQLLASPLMDETGFTRDLERLYLDAWARSACSGTAAMAVPNHVNGSSA